MWLDTVCRCWYGTVQHLQTRTLVHCAACRQFQSRNSGISYPSTSSNSAYLGHHLSSPRLRLIKAFRCILHPSPHCLFIRRPHASLEEQVVVWCGGGVARMRTGTLLSPSAKLTARSRVVFLIGHGCATFQCIA
jgi:hypothetical protein